MKIYILAGEASGDLHGGNLISALRKNHPSLEIRAWGGEKIQQAGAELVKHYKNLAFMGFIEVLKNLPGIFKNFEFAKSDILHFKPAILILIDYPGFNLRMAKWAHKHHIRVVYYVLPQLWAWNAHRIKYLEKYTHIRLAILPFEKSYYQSKNLPVHYVGHPLVQTVAAFKKQNIKDSLDYQSLDPCEVIALLPGSRLQEIRRHTPLLISLVEKFPLLHFELALAPGLPEEMHFQLLQAFPKNFSISKNTYQILSKAKFAIVCSGTATLETALFKVPQIVFYRTNFLNYLLAKVLIKVKYISLVNLILQKPLVKEVVNPLNQEENLIKSFEELMKSENIEDIKRGYEEIDVKLGKKDASEECSKIIFNV
ncbi:MAG: hypothetical protein RLZZ417_1322 [Bacteroidota bacterium]